MENGKTGARILILREWKKKEEGEDENDDGVERAEKARDGERRRGD